MENIVALIHIVHSNRMVNQKGLALSFNIARLRVFAFGSMEHGLWRPIKSVCVTKWPIEHMNEWHHSPYNCCQQSEIKTQMVEINNKIDDEQQKNE